MSSCGRVPRRWAALPGRSPPFVIVGSRSSALGCPHCCGHALPQRSPPFGVEARRWAAHVVVGYPTSAFASSRCRRVAYLGVRLLSLSWGCVLRHWAAHVVVGSPRAAFASPCGRVVSDFLWWCSRCRGVGREQGSEALGTAIGKREQRKQATMKVVARFRDVPHTSHFLAPAPPTLRVLLRRA